MHDDPTPLVKEYPRLDPRLGRKMQLDARSLPFMVERAPLVPPTSKHWARRLGILDQGELGSCVGNAATGALATEPLSYRWQSTIKAEAFAVRLYKDCTLADPFDGQYPPTDTGTDGLTACQVLKKRGLIGSYRHASTLSGLVQLLQKGTVLMGTAWLDEFFEPDEDGFIDSGSMGSAVAGGHEFELIGVDLKGALADAVFTAANSWGPDWGQKGLFKFRAATYLELRSDTDLRQLVS